LLHGLCDSNRLVRLRAAEALVNLKTDTVSIFEKVVAARDRYAQYAYLTTIDNAGLQPDLEARVRSAEQLIGWLALPYLWVFELVAPVAEFAGVLTIALAAMLGVLSHRFFLQFLLFRVRIRHHNIHWRRVTGGADLQEIQRLERCGTTDQLLLLRTFSLSAATRGLETARPVAIPARRYDMETAEATGVGRQQRPQHWPSCGSCRLTLARLARCSENIPPRGQSGLLGLATLCRAGLHRG